MKKALAVILLTMIFSAPVAAVDFSLPDLQGNQHKLSDYRGKWVVINYWATWCPPCLEEIPDLVAFHDDHWDKDAVVLGVNFELIGEEQLDAFVADLYITYPILISSGLPITPMGNVPGLPTTVVISPEGIPVAQQVGPITQEALEKFILRKSSAVAVAQ